MLPLSRGVSMATRGDAATTRFAGIFRPVTRRSAGAPGTAGVPVCGVGVVDYRPAAPRLQLRLLLLFELGFAGAAFPFADSRRNIASRPRQ